METILSSVAPPFCSVRALNMGTPPSTPHLYTAMGNPNLYTFMGGRNKNIINRWVS